MRSIIRGALLSAGILVAGLAQAATTTPALPAVPSTNNILGLLNLPDPNGSLLPGVSNTLLGAGYGVLNTTTSGLNTLAGSLGSLPPGLNTLGQGIQIGTGVLNTAVGYATSLVIRTTWRAANGQLTVRDHRILPLVPTPINVDADLLPEFLVTATVAGLNAFTLKVDKALLAEQTIPLKLELVIPNPGAESATDYIAAGYDALDTGAPGNWSATLTLHSVSDPVRVRIDVRTRNADRSYALVTQFYEPAANGGRNASVDIRGEFTPVPTANSYDVTIGRNGETIGISSDTRSVVNADAVLRSPDNTEQRFNVSLNQLPTQTSVRLDTPAGVFGKVDYQASHTIGQVAATYQYVSDAGNPEADVITAEAGITGVPTQVQVELSTDEEAGTRVDYSASSRIETITFNLAGMPLIKNAENLVSRIDGLPSRLTVELPRDGTLVRYSSYGEPIDRILAYVYSDFTLFGYPGNFGYRSAPGDDTDNSNFGGGNDGITMREYPDGFILAAQLSGLRSAAIDLGEQVRIAVDVDPQLARPFGASVRQYAYPARAYTRPETYYEGYISGIPSNLQIAIPDTEDELRDPEDVLQRINYSADNRIELIDLRSNFGDREKYNRITIRNLPEHLNVCLGTQESGKSCLRSRPLDGRPSIASEQEHAVINIDDLDSASQDGQGAWSIDGMFCFDNNYGPGCEAGVTQNYLKISNLSLYNMQMGFYANLCSGLLFCGHIDGDTRGQPVSGSIQYWNRDLVRRGLFTYSILANVVFPQGFWLRQRYTDWSNDSLIASTDYADHAYGVPTPQTSYNCPAGTTLSAKIADNLGTVVYNQNIAPHYLCSNTTY